MVGIGRGIHPCRPVHAKKQLPWSFDQSNIYTRLKIDHLKKDRPILQRRNAVPVQRLFRKSKFCFPLRRVPDWQEKTSPALQRGIYGSIFGTQTIVTLNLFQGPCRSSHGPCRTRHGCWNKFSMTSAVGGLLSLTPRHPGLDPGSRFYRTAAQGSGTPGQARGDGK